MLWEQLPLVTAAQTSVCLSCFRVWASFFKHCVLGVFLLVSFIVKIKVC